MLYIMYNMAQSPPGGIRRDLSGDPRKADEGTRTPDLLITSELLYQLSYVGATAGSLEGASGPDKRRIRPTNHPYWTRRLWTRHPRIRYCRWAGHDSWSPYASPWDDVSGACFVWTWPFERLLLPCPRPCPRPCYLPCHRPCCLPGHRVSRHLRPDPWAEIPRRSNPPRIRSPVPRHLPLDPETRAGHQVEVRFPRALLPNLPCIVCPHTCTGRPERLQWCRLPASR